MSSTLKARSGMVDLTDPRLWTSPAGSSSRPGAREFSGLTLLFPLRRFVQSQQQSIMASNPGLMLLKLCSLLFIARSLLLSLAVC